jgi:hypothetical protein
LEPRVQLLVLVAEAGHGLGHHHHRRLTREARHVHRLLEADRGACHEAAVVEAAGIVERGGAGGQAVGVATVADLGGGPLQHQLHQLGVARRAECHRGGQVGDREVERRRPQGLGTRTAQVVAGLGGAAQRGARGEVPRQLGEHRPAISLVHQLQRLGDAEVQARAAHGCHRLLDRVTHERVGELVGEQHLADVGQQAGFDQLVEAVSDLV